jgi:GTP:adenosylcobinamide-phosphate guanylyltransferase
MVGPEFARAIGTEVKALAPLGTRRLIDPAIAAARGIGVTAIAVVGGPAVAHHCGSRVERVIDAAPSGTENIMRALRAFPDAERLLFLTSDLPFIDAAGLSGFLERSASAELTMALAPGAAYIARFPGASPHLVRCGRETFANGSVFCIDRAAIGALERVAGSFFSARKSLARLATLLGPALCLRFIFRRLTITDIEQRAATVLGVRARAIVDAAPGLCYDVDDQADWTYAQSLVRLDG